MPLVSQNKWQPCWAPYAVARICYAGRPTEGYGRISQQAGEGLLYSRQRVSFVSPIQPHIHWNTDMKHIATCTGRAVVTPQINFYIRRASWDLSQCILRPSDRSTAITLWVVALDRCKDLIKGYRRVHKSPTWWVSNYHIRSILGMRFMLRQMWTNVRKTIWTRDVMGREIPSLKLGKSPHRYSLIWPFATMEQKLQESDLPKSPQGF